MKNSTKNAIGNAVVWTLAMAVLMALTVEVIIGLENLPDFISCMANIIW